MARYEVPAVRPWILCPSRFKPEKGHTVLLEAMAALKQQGLTPHVLFAGDGPLQQPAEYRARELGLEAQCRFLGQVAPGELLALMREADLVTVPSTHEGFGLAIVEAMALGCPVIATAVGGVPEVVVSGSSGLLANPAILNRSRWN